MLSQMEAASAAELHYAALAIALTIPDQCAALASEDGRTDGPRYAAWFDANMTGGYLERPWRSAPDAPVWLSEECYRYRCAILHQGTGSHDRALARRIIFSIDGSHLILVADSHILLDARRFVADMSTSARTWLASNAASQTVSTHLARSMSTHETGLTLDGVHHDGLIIA